SSAGFAGAIEFWGEVSEGGRSPPPSPTKRAGPGWWRSSYSRAGNSMRLGTRTATSDKAAFERRLCRRNRVWGGGLGGGPNPPPSPIRRAGPGWWRSSYSRAASSMRLGIRTATSAMAAFERRLRRRNRILGGGFGRGAKPPSESDQTGWTG